MRSLRTAWRSEAEKSPPYNSRSIRRTPVMAEPAYSIPGAPAGRLRQSDRSRQGGVEAM